MFTTYHNFKYCGFIWWNVSGRRVFCRTAAIFLHPTAWSYCNLGRTLVASIGTGLGGCTDLMRTNVFQEINLQKTFKVIFTHLKLKPLAMSIEGSSYYFHKLGLVNTKPSTNCNLHTRIYNQIQTGNGKFAQLLLKINIVQTGKMLRHVYHEQMVYAAFDQIPSHLIALCPAIW